MVKKRPPRPAAAATPPPLLAATPPPPSPGLAPPQLPSYFDDPDFVDRLFAYMLELLPELAPRAAAVKRALRGEFAGGRVYVRRSDGTPSQRAEQLRLMVRSMFNGRNASEVARILRISRATVYRCLKQPGPPGP